MKPPAPDSLPTAATAAAPWWKEFFRPVPIARVSDHPSAGAVPAADPEPVVATCRFRSP